MGSSLSIEANIDVEINNIIFKSNSAFGRLRKKVWERRGISRYTNLMVDLYILYMVVVLTILL